MIQDFDHRFKFTLASLPQALTALTALRQIGLVGAGDIPQNMLGDPRDTQGNVVTTAPAFVGRQGIPASSYTDPQGTIITIPAKGDPGCWYVAIRTQVDPSTLPLNPADYGLETCPADESAAVLGVWS
jgi:hypothetical protein